MGDYAPRIKGTAITSQASATIAGGQLVGVSGSGTVAKTAGATTAWLGVAGFDVVNGDKVTIEKGGVQRILAAGLVTAGDQVVPAANGCVASLAAAGVLADLAAASTAINAARQVVGTALTTGTDVVVEIDMER